MEDKLLAFVKDMNEILFEIDPQTFEDFPLAYSTNGNVSVIEFAGEVLFSTEEHSDWKDLLKETHQLSHLCSKLHRTIMEFFYISSNEHIEEKYGLGIEGPTTPLSERDRPEV